METEDNNTNTNSQIVECGQVKVNQGTQPEVEERQKIVYKVIGKDVIIDPKEKEISLISLRIGKLEGLSQHTEITSLCLRNNLIPCIEGLSANVNLIELELYDNKLTKIEGLETLVNLRILDLSYNNIKKIEGLETLRKVEKLYLLSNKIKVIENIDFPELTMLELGSNKIQVIQNLDKLPKLTELYLGKNHITTIENLEPLAPTLSTLALTANRLKKIGGGLVSLVNLKELYIAENFLENIEGVESLINLTLLDLSMNKIPRIENISTLKELTELWLNVNLIENFQDLDELKHNQKIETVYLSTNPVSRFPSYRQKLMEVLPNIQQIDATYLNIEYVVKSAETHITSIMSKPGDEEEDEEEEN